MSKTPVPVAPTSDKAGTNPYHLPGGWDKALIDMSGFPLKVMQALKDAGLETDQPQPGDKIAAALAKISNRDIVSQVQQMLFYGGFYSGVTNMSELQLGRFQDKDISALGNLIQTGGQTGQPLGSYLVGAANYGQAQGTINKVAGIGVKPIPLPADMDIDAVLRASAEKLLHREPSSGDLAEFRGIYDKMLISASKQAAALAAQDTAAGLPDAESLGSAAGRLGEPGFFGDQRDAPPSNLSGQGAIKLQQAIGREDGESPIINPAFTAYQAQQAADQTTLGQFGSAADSAIAGATPTLTSAPNISTAAEQFLQDRYGAQITQESALGKYSKLLAFMRGNGS